MPFQSSCLLVTSAAYVPDWTGEVTVEIIDEPPNEYQPVNPFSKPEFCMTFVPDGCSGVGELRYAYLLHITDLQSQR